MWRAHGVDVASDHTLFVAGEPGILTIVDVTDPRAPIQLGTCTYGFHSTTDVAFDPSSGFAFALGYDGLYAIDVSDRVTPLLTSVVPLGRIGHRTGLYRLEVVDGAAYAAIDGPGLRLLDIRRPAQPIETATHQWSWSMARDVSVANGVAYVADEPTGIRVTDVSDARRPQSTATYEAPLSGAVREVRVVEDRAYVVHGLNPTRLSMFDIGVGGPARLLGEIENGGWSLLGDEGHLYGVSSDAGGIKHFVGPEEPAVLDARDLADYYALEPADIARTEGYAYAAGYGTNVAIYRAVRPDKWEEIGEYPVYDESLEDWFVPTRIEVQGARMFAIGRWAMGDLSSAALQVLDLTDPEHPEEVGRLEIPEEAGNLLVARPPRVYNVGPPAYGMRVFDVSDPGRPILARASADPSHGEHLWFQPRIFIDSEQLFVVSDDLVVMDLYAPNSPVLVGRYTPPCAMEAADAAPDAILLACGDEGLMRIARPPRISLTRKALPSLER